MANDWITIGEACQLLDISRPTLNIYRNKYKVRESNFKRKVLLSKTDLIKKVLLKNFPERKLDFTMPGQFEMSQLQPLTGVFDLRRFNKIDSYGVMNLLCLMRSFLEVDPNNRVHLILDGSDPCSYLDSMDFFSVLSRGCPERVISNQNDIIKRKSFCSMLVWPLSSIGYRGAEKKILEELFKDLLKQGFSENFCAYMGWVIGELCDNTHTHSRSFCYLFVEPLMQKSSHTRILSVCVGDVGLGIQESLKSNPRYSKLMDTQAFVESFRSQTSRMEYKRGKGLNDVLAISKGNKSWLRVDSNGTSILFDFQKKDMIQVTPSIMPTRGTRFHIVLFDSDFDNIKREEIDDLINKFKETL